MADYRCGAGSIQVDSKNILVQIVKTHSKTTRSYPKDSRDKVKRSYVNKDGDF